jgi:hypothetical protein
MSQSTSSDTFNATTEPTATETTLRLSGYALLIGIESYRSFDPEGRFDLPAGRNDVLAFYRVARKLGFSADRIRVLTTPLLEPSQLLEMEKLLDPTAKEDDLAQRVSGVERREATRQEFLDGERWLADKLTAKQVQGAHPLGLMTYSGHGSRLGSELDLCPSDVGPNLENAIDFSELRSILRGEPAEHLTTVLDCCFAEKDFDRQGDPFKLAYLPVSRSGAVSPASPAEDALLAARVFSATRQDQNGYQSKFGGRWHGAFTWAFTVALDQWKIVEEEHFKRSTVSHGELLRRTRLLLDALDFPQEPTLADEEWLAKLPLFHHASNVSGETATSPDRGRHDVQLDPSCLVSCYYSISAGGAEIAAVLLEYGNGDCGEAPGQIYERWHIEGNQFKTTTSTPIAITKTEGTIDSNLIRRFSVPNEASWSAEARQVGNILVSIANGRIYGLSADVAYDNATGEWKGYIHWYNNARTCVFKESKRGQVHEFTLPQGGPHVLFRAENCLPPTRCPK